MLHWRKVNLMMVISKNALAVIFGQVIKCSPGTLAGVSSFVEESAVLIEHLLP